MRTQLPGPDVTGLQDRAGRAADLLGERVEHVLDADLLHLLALGVALGSTEQLDEGLREIGLAGALGQAAQRGVGLGEQVGRLGTGATEHLGDPAIAVDRAVEQVDGLDVDVLPLVGELLRPRDQRASVGGIAIEVQCLGRRHRDGSVDQIAPCESATLRAMSRPATLWIALLACASLGASPHYGIFTGAIGKTKIPPPLEKKSSSDTTGAVVVLAPPIEGMIAFSAGSFEMGSGAVDQKAALGTCKQEVLGVACRYEQFAGEGVQRAARDAGGKDVIEITPGTRTVQLSAFLIDRTEVTVAAYQRCVELGECRVAGYQPGDPKHDRPELPVTDVTWDDAARFCAFRGARLPTEAEWERAARGASGRRYPWGMLANPKLANAGALDVGSVIVPSSSSSALAGLILAGVPDDDDGFVGLAPVGSFPEGGTPEGVVDLAGNAAEWVSDVWEDGYDPAELVDPGGPSTGILRVVRGGSFRQPLAMIRGASRGFRFPSTRDPDVGFRCARTKTVD